MSDTPPSVYTAEPFQNEPPTDFSRKEHRKAFQTALDDVREQLGREYDLVIDGKAVSSRKSIVSLNPSKKSQTSRPTNRRRCSLRTG